MHELLHKAWSVLFQTKRAVLATFVPNALPYLDENSTTTMTEKRLISQHNIKSDVRTINQSDIKHALWESLEPQKRRNKKNIMKNYDQWFKQAVKNLINFFASYQELLYPQISFYKILCTSVIDLKVLPTTPGCCSCWTVSKIFVSKSLVTWLILRSRDLLWDLNRHQQKYWRTNIP